MSVSTNEFMMTRNIFLVKSPLQLLNAIEAKNYYNIKDDECVLVILGDSKSYSQLINLASISNQWEHIVMLSSVSLMFFDPWQTTAIDTKNTNKSIMRSTFFTIRRLNRMAKNIGTVIRIFIGDYNYLYMRHFINLVPHSETVLLDDGTATMEVGRRRLSNIDENEIPNIEKAVKIYAKRIMLGLNDKDPKRLTFFSAYDIETRNNDKVIKNSFRYLKSASKSMTKDNSVYFLGSPLIETGVVSQKDYIAQLSLIKEYYINKEVIYISHRREDKENLNFIRRDLNIKICSFDYPIEYQISILGPVPSVVSSFVSSALENIRLIMDDELSVVSFKLIDGTYEKKDRMNAVYDYYREHVNDSFNLIILDEIKSNL